MVFGVKNNQLLEVHKVSYVDPINIVVYHFPDGCLQGEAHITYPIVIHSNLLHIVGLKNPFLSNHIVDICDHMLDSHM